MSWSAALLLALSLSACGGSVTMDNAQTKDAASTQTSSTGSTDSTLATGSVLSSTELAAAEKAAVAADASGSATALDELKPGQIAAKSAYSSGAVARKALATRIPVYRFYNNSTGAHFFTTNTTERDNIVATLSPPFSLEGSAFSVASTFSPGLSPVHRFYNTQTGVHFYTISETERANVVATLPHFTYEGVAYHASQVGGQGLIPFYRFYVPSKGFHFYTANEAEKDSIIANLAATYSFEGIGYYVLDTDWRAEKLPHSGVTSNQCYRSGSDTLTACSSTLATAFNAQQDGHRAAINAMSYSAVDSHPLTSCVKDNVTGLIWEGKTASGARAGSNTYTNEGGGAADDASGYVVAVNASSLCGFSDWRLPTRQELLTLADYGSSSAPKLNIASFPNTASAGHWSSDVLINGGPRTWQVSFAAASGHSYVAFRTTPSAVRLVRGNVSIHPRFTFGTVANGSDGANNVVNDAWTGLQWRRCEEGRVWSGSACTGSANTFTHDQAVAHAPSQSGWRLPNVKELASLADLSVGTGARLDAAAFPGAGLLAFWSSSPYVEDAAAAWAVYFSDGSVLYGNRGVSYAVRLVRAAP